MDEISGFHSHRRSLSSVKSASKVHARRLHPAGNPRPGLRLARSVTLKRITFNDCRHEKPLRGHDSTLLAALQSAHTHQVLDLRSGAGGPCFVMSHFGGQ